jgi:beta-N-acetylhexosaminidase
MLTPALFHVLRKNGAEQPDRDPVCTGRYIVRLGDLTQHHMTKTRLAALLALALACTGCGPTSVGSSASSSPRAAATTSLPSPSASSDQASSAQAAAESSPARVYAGMTEAQRVGQLFIVGIAGDPNSVIAPAVATYHFGSLLFASTNTAGVSAVLAMSQAVQSMATTRATAKTGFFIGANQEGGEVQQLQGPGFATIPSAVEQGQLPPATLQKLAAHWGRELKAAGVNLDLAPVLDVVPTATQEQNQPIGVLDREYGHEPRTVTVHGVAFIRGMRQAGIATTAKHFPGLGRVVLNTDFSSGVVDTITTPNDPYLSTYQAAINVGVPFVMVSLATYARIDPHHLAAFSSLVMRTILRQQMHFRGVIISDDLGAAAAVAAVAPPTRAIDFLTAGGDMITSASLPAAEVMATEVLRRADANAAFRSDVESADMRILAAKQSSGLLPCG